MDLPGAELLEPGLTTPTEDEIFTIGPVEVTLGISENSVSAVLSDQTCSFLCYKTEIPDVRVRIPDAQEMQMAQQCFVTGSNIGIYLCGAGRGTVSTAVPMYPDGFVEAVTGAICTSLFPMLLVGSLRRGYYI